MIPALPASRLARGLGPLGVIGSCLLHGAVLAALVNAAGTRPSAPATVPPALTVALLTVTPLQAVADPAPAEMPAPLRADTNPPEPPRPTQTAATVPPPPRPKPAPRPTKPAASLGQTVVPAAVPTETTAPAASGTPTEIATATPAPADPVQISTTRFRDRAPPPYPPQALRDEIEGVVRLKLLVSPAGRVLDASVLKSSGHRPLDQAAVTAAQGWTLYPAEKDGQPVPGWAEVDVPFRLID